MMTLLSNLFETSAQVAVQASLSESKPLFVYMEEDRATEEVSPLIEKYLIDVKDNKIKDEYISFLKKRFICLKLIQGSTDYSFFEQLFPNIEFPSFYLISKGKLLDIITLESQLDQKGFITRLTTLSPDHQKRGSTEMSDGTDAATEKQSSHQESVRKHQQDVAAYKKEQAQEHQRIKALLEADKRERESMKRERNGSIQPKRNDVRPSKSAVCSLVIRLFDGDSVKNDFSSSQTLNDVRIWLDNSSNPPIIKNTNSSMPSFAKSLNPQPTHYLFHRPGIPRVTYTDSQEFEKLVDLDLCPRLALILKPIYDDKFSSLYPDGNRSSFGMLGSFGQSVRKFGNALYLFFDYGVDETDIPTHNNNEDEPSPNEINDEFNDSSRSSGYNRLNLENSNIGAGMDDYFQSNHSSGPQQDSSDPERKLASRAHSASLINFGNTATTRPISVLHQPSFHSTNYVIGGDDHDDTEERPLHDSGSVSNLTSRLSTPKPMGNLPSISRVQTIRPEEQDQSNESTTNDSDEDKKDK